MTTTSSHIQHMPAYWSYHLSVSNFTQARSIMPIYTHRKFNEPGIFALRHGEQRGTCIRTILAERILWVMVTMRLVRQLISCTPHIAHPFTFATSVLPVFAVAVALTSDTKNIRATCYVHAHAARNMRAPNALGMECLFVDPHACSLAHTYLRTKIK